MVLSVTDRHAYRVDRWKDVVEHVCVVQCAASVLPSYVLPLTRGCLTGATGPFPRFCWGLIRLGAPVLRCQGRGLLLCPSAVVFSFLDLSPCSVRPVRGRVAPKASAYT